MPESRNQLSASNRYWVSKSDSQKGPPGDSDMIEVSTLYVYSGEKGLENVHTGPCYPRTREREEISAIKKLYFRQLK